MRCEVSRSRSVLTSAEDAVALVVDHDMMVQRSAPLT
jgi:hypothetical protein